MKKMKRTISAFCAALLIVGLCPTTIRATENVESIDAQSVAKVNEQSCALNYHDVDYTAERPGQKGIPANYAEYIPSAYSSVTEGRTTGVKSQGDYGTCWAFSATVAAEGSYCMNSGASEAADLSELQLAYFFYHDRVDPLGNLNGDSTVPILGEDETFLDAGGNHLYTIWGLAGWTNGTLEETLPYSTTNCKAALNGKISNEYAYKDDVAHLQNAYMIPCSQDTDRTAIKKAIMKYGAVGCSYYDDDPYYNESTAAYYCDKSSSNHAVAVVGWNDEYPIENFNKDRRPTQKGAWLVKNSWGTWWGTDGDTDPANKGVTEKGYFWLSYQDASFCSRDQVFAYDFEPVSKYQNNYQYDGSFGIEKLSVTTGSKVCAIYEANSPTGDVEQIKAVGIGLYSTNVSGKIYIYVDPQDGQPTTGDLKVNGLSFDTSTRGGYEGFYTFDIPNGPVIRHGQKYSVVVEFNQGCKIAVDSSYSGGWLEFMADTTQDKTYLANGNTVTNLGTAYDYTARLKAYTNDVSLLGDTRVVRTAADSAVFTLTPTTSGTLYYMISDTPVTNTASFTDNVNVTANTPAQINLTLSQAQDQGTMLYYYLKDGSGATGDIASLHIPAYAARITIESPENGSLEVAYDGGTVTNGTYVPLGKTCTITATPSSGYAFGKLYVDGAVIDGNTFTVSGAHTVSATFVKLYQLTVAEDSQAYLTLSKTAVIPGETIRITVNRSGENFLYADGEQIGRRTGSGSIDYTPTGDCTISLENYWAIGTSGNLSWYLTNDGELILSGTGAMPNYTTRSSNRAPWYSYRSSIQKATVESGVTGIGEYAFYGCSQITTVVLPSGVTSIGKYAFNSCTALKDVFFVDAAGKWTMPRINNGNNPVQTTAATWHKIKSPDDIATLNKDTCANGRVSLSQTMGAVGETIIVTATPNTGYYVVGYTVNGVAMSGSSYQLPAGGNYSFGAVLKHIPDLNGDDAMSCADLTILVRHVTGIQEITDETKLDWANVNGDANVNAADITALARMLTAR